MQITKVYCKQVAMSTNLNDFHEAIQLFTSPGFNLLQQTQK